MRLGQVHCTAPFARNHVRCIFGLLFFAALDQNRGHCALGQTRIHRERHVGACHKLFKGHGDNVRHALATKLLRRGQCAPATLAVKFVSFLEAIGRGHAAIFMPRAALQVTDLVQGEQHIFHKLRAFGQDCVDHVRAGVLKTRQIGVAFNAQNFVEDELRVANGGGIAWHFRSLK